MFLLAFFTSIAVTIFTSSTPVETNYTIRMLQVWHRHGARTVVLSTSTAECSAANNCGQLTRNGMLQLNAVGEYIREHYGSESSAPIYNSSRYTPSQVIANASHFDRTIQSAQALLYTMYESRDNFYPVVNTIERDVDMPLNTDNVPAVIGVYRLDVKKMMTALTLYVLSVFKMPELQAIAAEANVSSLCESQRSVVGCTYSLYDLATSMEAEGTLSSLPLVYANMDRLRNVQTKFFRLIFEHNSSDPLRAQQGSMGQIAAQAMIKNMMDWMNTSEYPVRIFSTHDTNIVPLSVTMGDMSDISICPNYGTALLVELLESQTDASLHVRVKRGEPRAASDNITNFTFRLQEFTQHCMSSNGKAYTAEICPIEHFIRFIHSTVGTSQEGLCAITEEAKKALGCPAEPTPGTMPSTRCLHYRRNCPEWSCGANEILGAHDYQCYSTLNINLQQSKMSVKSALLNYATSLAGMPVINYVKSKL